MDINTLDTLYAPLDNTSIPALVSTSDEPCTPPPTDGAVLPSSASLASACKPLHKRSASASSSEGSNQSPSPRTSSPCAFKPSSRRQDLSPSSGSDESDSNEYRANTTQLRQRHHLGPRPKSTWAHHKDLKTRSKLADFEPNNIRLSQFQHKIKMDDAHVEFDLQDPRRVRCSNCAVWIMMRQLYDIQRWKDHRRSAKCQVRQQRGLVNQSIQAFFTKNVVQALTAIPPISDKVPCPGLRQETNVKVAVYIKRTLAPGGGAPSRPAIAKIIFGPKAMYTQLSNNDKKLVLRRENQLYQWRIVHSAGSVYSTKCVEMVPTLRHGKEPRTCVECCNLLSLQSFKVALQRKEVTEDKMKYTPIAWRDPDVSDIYLKVKGICELVEQVAHFPFHILNFELGAYYSLHLQDNGSSPWLNFAKGVADGLYARQDVILGMIQVLVKKTERLSKGQTLKNMSYPPAFNNFCNLLASTSTRAYKTFQKQFGGHGIRNMR